jgi:ferredoxin
MTQVLFALLVCAAGTAFALRVRAIRKAILLGRPWTPQGSAAARWGQMARVALGQGKMTTRPVAGIFHIIIYAGFVLINLEMLEIVVDGLTGKHRVFSGIGPVYDAGIAVFEVLAAGVLIACVVFFVRRNVLSIARFRSPELRGQPSLDANIILVVEAVLMFALLTMNAADALAQTRGLAHYPVAGTFPVSAWLQPLYSGLSDSGLVALERAAWWTHIVGVLGFLVYVPYSKHFHILLAFPNTFYADAGRPSGQMENMPVVQGEVAAMLDPSVAPPAAADGAPPRFGARDATDLTWKQLLEAYTCTECGRCTSVCPANLTGKKLSPRKIMMDTRDRIEEIGRTGGNDGRSLLGNFITEEELWACTSCQACVEACPVLISPMGIVLDMRRSLIMEESKSPDALTGMFNNVENNGAPWAFPAAARGDWAAHV